MRVVLFVDEFANYISARTAQDDAPLVRMMRSWRHVPANLLLTSQHLTGDVPQAVFSCAPRIFLFRSTALPVLKRLEEHFSLDRGKVRTLEQFEYLELYEGF